MVTFFRRKPGCEHRSSEPLGKPGGMIPPEYVLFEVKLSEMLFPVFLRLEIQYRPLRSYIYVYHVNMCKKCLFLDSKITRKGMTKKKQTNKQRYKTEKEINSANI